MLAIAWSLKHAWIFILGCARLSYINKPKFPIGHLHNNRDISSIVKSMYQQSQTENTQVSICNTVYSWSMEWRSRCSDINSHHNIILVNRIEELMLPPKILLLKPWLTQFVLNQMVMTFPSLKDSRTDCIYFFIWKSLWVWTWSLHQGPHLCYFFLIQKISSSARKIRFLQ